MLSLTQNTKTIFQTLVILTGLGCSLQTHGSQNPTSGKGSLNKRLIKNTINLQQPCKSPKLALHRACEKGNLKRVRLLIESDNLDVNQQDKDGWTPLHCACANGHWPNALKIVKYLKQKNANIEATTIVFGKKGETPLHIACREGHLKIVQYLVEAGANIEARNHLQETPLLCAADTYFTDGNLAIIRYLLEKNADITAAGKWGNILHLAPENKTLEDLLQAQTSVKKATILLCKAIGKNDEQSCKEAIQKGAYVNIAGPKTGKTPLYLVCITGHLNIAKLLLQEKANVNATDRDDATPLHVACSCGHLNIVKLLVEHGAMIDQNSINLANGYKEIKDFLLTARQKPVFKF